MLSAASACSKARLIQVPNFNGSGCIQYWSQAAMKSCPGMKLMFSGLVIGFTSAVQRSVPSTLGNMIAPTVKRSASGASAAINAWPAARYLGCGPAGVSKLLIMLSDRSNTMSTLPGSTTSRISASRLTLPQPSSPPAPDAPAPPVPSA